jgi:alpha-D-ribose 1-methylphosphonate 5-triphosphate synthase subunit PhnG
MFTSDPIKIGLSAIPGGIGGTGKAFHAIEFSVKLMWV